MTKPEWQNQNGKTKETIQTSWITIKVCLKLSEEIKMTYAVFKLTNEEQQQPAFIYFLEKYIPVTVLDKVVESDVLEDGYPILICQKQT